MCRVGFRLCVSLIHSSHFRQEASFRRPSSSTRLIIHHPYQNPFFSVSIGFLYQIDHPSSPTRTRFRIRRFLCLIPRQSSASFASVAESVFDGSDEAGHGWRSRGAFASSHVIATCPTIHVRRRRALVPALHRPPSLRTIPRPPAAQVRGVPPALFPPTTHWLRPSSPLLRRLRRRLT